MSIDYDAIVIGSGFGGAVTACRLAERGKRVCVLERGQQFPRGNRGFPDSFFGVTREGVWNETRGKYGIVEYQKYPQVDIIQGSGVGGGSLHYYGVTIRAPDSTFRDARWPSAITASSLDRFYRKAETMLDATPIRPSRVQPSLPRRTNVFFDVMARAGASPVERINLAINFGQRFDAAAHEICDYRGDCLIGCNINAKNTLDLNYLKRAEALGTTIRPLCKVTVIRPNEDGSYAVRFQGLNGSPSGELTATRVVLAAGSLGTTELLLKNKFQHQTLPNIGDALGRNFSTNGDFLYSGTQMPLRSFVFPMDGPNVTAGAEFRFDNDPNDELRLYVEDLGITDVLKIFLRKTILGRGRFLPFLQDYLRGEMAFEPRIRRQARGFSPRVNRFLPYLVMGKDSASGSMRLDRRWNLQVDWPFAENRQMYNRMRSLLDRASRNVGGRYIDNIWDLNHKAFTAHPLGGCVIGDSDRNAVVDINGQVYGYQNLFVADGSLVPTALGANPSLTISALAEWIAERMAF